VDALIRVHVPKATLANVQQAIMSGALGPRDDADEQLEIGTDKTSTAAAPRVTVLGPPLSETSLASQGGSPNAFPFDLVLNSAEPWRLMTSHVHTFHVVTSAVSALVAARTSLPAYAVSLGLGTQTPMHS